MSCSKSPFREKQKSLLSQARDIKEQLLDPHLQRVQQSSHMVPEGCQYFFEKVPARFQKGFSRTPGVLDSSQEYQQQVPRRRASSLSVRPASPLPERTQHIKQSQKALKRSKKKKSGNNTHQNETPQEFPNVLSRWFQEVPARVSKRFWQGSGRFQHGSSTLPRRSQDSSKTVSARFRQGCIFVAPLPGPRD